jgi:hypothetical protein
MGTGGCFPGVKRLGRKADKTPILLPRFRMVGAIPLSIHAFMAGMGTYFSFLLKPYFILMSCY